MDDIIGDLGDFIFSLFISYIGAMELLFVVRHLCHNAAQHPTQQQQQQPETDDSELKEFQEQMRRQLAKATEIEEQAGANAMQDGVLYSKDGFRLDPQQAEIERLKSEMESKGARDKRRAEIEEELARQRKIEEETRKQLEKAEAELMRQRQEAEDEKNRRAAAEEAESLRQMLEAERQREAEQRRQEEAEAEAAEKKLAEAQYAESQREILAAELQREAHQRQIEEQQEAKGEQTTGSDSRRFLDAERLQDLETSESDESDLRVGVKLSREPSNESRQRSIEENARKFLEAEQEMVALQQQQHLLEGAPIVEEQFTKRSHTSSESTRPRNETVTTTVKTQFGQGSNESFSLTTKPLLFPGISDDASSNEPFSSKQSSLSTQPSEEITTTGTEDASKSTIGLQIPQHERQEPDGEDNAPPMQYSEDYLRSLDGIKARSLIREDGSGRRRAFKKRRSSGSSNSSRESRASREEELKMFTSLEEEELQNTVKGDNDFTPIKYTNEPTLKVKTHHHRRHKRSPAKDAKAEEQVRTSLEMLGEEGSNPWGEVVPEHYKDMEFWKREKAMSIDEEEIDLDLPKSHVETTSESATNKLSSSSFEEASHEQNEEAISVFQKQQQLPKSPETEEQLDPNMENPDDSQSINESRSNLITSHEAESKASPARSSSSPRLRRSPRIDEMDQYEDRWRESEIATKNRTQPNSPTTPSISINPCGDAASWRDEHGLILQGLSDFYDFTASTNPSRSRPTSRNASPANTVPNTPVNEFPGNFVDCKSEQDILPVFIEPPYDEQINEEHRTKVLQSPRRVEEDSIPVIHIESDGPSENAYDNEVNSREEMASLVQTLRAQRAASRSRSRSPLPTTENLVRSLESRRAKLIKHNDEIFEKLTDENKNLGAFGSEKNTEMEPLSDDQPNGENSHDEMNSLVQSLRAERVASRSRSRSPLPTTDQLTRSLENRRSKLIQHNDEIFEKLTAKASNHSGDTSESLEPANPFHDHTGESNTHEEMNSLVAQLRAERVASRSRSRSPLPSSENLTRSLESRRSKLIKHNDEIFEKLTGETWDNNHTVEPSFNTKEYVDKDHSVEENSREEMISLVQTLRTERSRSPSRSRSRSPIAENITSSLESRQSKFIEHNDETGAAISYKENSESLNNWKQIQSPVITVESVEIKSTLADFEDTKEDVSSLVASLRVARARSRSISKSPMRIPTAKNLEESINKRREKLIERNDQLGLELEERAKSPQPPRVVVQYQYEYEESTEETQQTSLTESSMHPSRSRSPQQHIAASDEDENFHRMLNLESSQNRTLFKNSEELESIMAVKQRHIDEEGLYKLKTANEEMELRTVTPTDLWSSSQMEADFPESSSLDTEDKDLLSELPMKERLQKLRCTPSTPEYSRNISEERRDVQRIKNEMLASGFKRSTYVGESMDLGSEYEDLRLEAAEFRRSKTPSPSFEEPSVENTVRQTAAERRRIQDDILSELVMSSSSKGRIDEDRNDAKPINAQSSSEECEVIQRESEDMADAQYEEMRREMVDFRRSRSCSRSPVDERTAEELMPIDVEVTKRAMQDEMLDKLSGTGVCFQDFSRHLKADFLDDRRASDSAVIQKPEFKMQYRDAHYEYELEPEEYHHYRRFSLNQEQPTEEYPNDEFVYISQVEVHTLTGTRTWTREDFYSADFDDMPMELERAESSDQAEHDQVDPEIVRDEEESDGSEDERQTVVEVDDEIDTDICDFNERGPTDESHHEQSECEEAERAMDHYANHEANDWHDVADVNDILSNNEADIDEEGAIGGTDTDSFTIDQIYGEAIKNRKQSGILREYDSILLEMQKNFERNGECDEISDNDRYALWSKTRPNTKDKRCSVSFLENERQDTEMRYLGDANLTSRQSTRLRSRYGFVPQPQNNSIENLDVDLNYKPKREYNWRKNFKLDDELEPDESRRGSREVDDELFDERKYSLGGESITLFSRSPEREIIDLTTSNREREIRTQGILTSVEATLKPELTNGDNENAIPAKDKPKKKKSKKKALREAKEQIERRLSKEEEDSDSLTYSRRSSSIQMETDSPKRKSRSRRSSRSSITTEDSNALFSPRSSVGFMDHGIANARDFVELGAETEREPLKKKMKKRKKVKDTFAVSQDIKEEQEQVNDTVMLETPDTTVTVSSNISPDSASLNILSALSPQNSICESESTTMPATSPSNSTTETATAPTTTTTTATAPAPTTIETFDILKDANFYPLF